MNRLLEESTREQLLTWLVRGAVTWFKNKDLSAQPHAMLAAFKVYIDENDRLQQFIDMRCETSEKSYVNAGNFQEYFCKDMNTTMMQNKLSVIMAEKGFIATVPRINGKSQKMYKGLRFSDTTDTL